MTGHDDRPRVGRHRAADRARCSGRAHDARELAVRGGAPRGHGLRGAKDLRREGRHARDVERHAPSSCGLPARCSRTRAIASFTHGGVRLLARRACCRRSSSRAARTRVAPRSSSGSCTHVRPASLHATPHGPIAVSNSVQGMAPILAPRAEEEASLLGRALHSLVDDDLLARPRGRGRRRPCGAGRRSGCGGRSGCRRRKKSSRSPSATQTRPALSLFFASRASFSLMPLITPARNVRRSRLLKMPCSTLCSIQRRAAVCTR